MNTVEGYMLEAIELAKKGRGKVSPNPLGQGATLREFGKIIQLLHRLSDDDYL